jgi:hypothetical protein
MNRRNCLSLFTAGLFGCAVLAGCDQPERRQAMAPRPRYPVVQSQQPGMGQQAVAVAPPQQAVAAYSNGSPSIPVRPAQVAAPAPAGDEEASDPPAPAPVAKTPPSHRGEEPPQRKAFGDVTAHSSFGHAPDYSWLSGEVEYSRISKGWRLRYASVDEEDTYGGSVTLMEHPLLRGLKDGQYVRVQGRLSNPEVRSSAPQFLIDSLQPLQPLRSSDAPEPVREEQP